MAPVWRNAFIHTLTVLTFWDRNRAEKKKQNVYECRIRSSAGTCAAVETKAHYAGQREASSSQVHCKI
jgi:hypothetical protein